MTEPSCNARPAAYPALVWRYLARCVRDLWEAIPAGLDLLTESVGLLIRATIVTALLLTLPALAAAAVIAALR